MRPINADKDVWLRAQTSNQKIKQYVQIQDADGTQTYSVLFMTKVKAIFLQYYISFEGGRAQSPRPPTFPLRLRPSTCSTLKRKSSDIRHLRRVKFLQ